VTAAELPADPLATLRDRLRDNIAATRATIAAACGRAGRPPADVRLVAVTKYVSAEITRLVTEVGLVDLAESRPQAIWSKAEALAGTQPAVRWHLIGHLQRNKVRRTLPLLTMLHSLDSLRLLEAVAAEAGREPRDAAVELLVEVNLTADPGRSGALPAEVPALVAAAAAAPHVRLRGLMAMAARPDGADADARRDFARLRGLRDELARSAADPAQLAELSMGMSGDFEAAILEGATIVRIGSALFEGVA
jgi:pyridoxal phosphate enzyme (YggS family)